MTRVVTILTSGALCLALVACSGGPIPSATHLAQAPMRNVCDRVDVDHDSPDMAASLKGALQGKTPVPTIDARARGTQCRGSASSSAEPSFTPTSIDFTISLPQPDLTANGQISSFTSIILSALEQISPNMPGSVDLTYTNADTSLRMAFSRDQARTAMASGQSGVNLLASLGYPPAATAGAGCSDVWGKQPLLDLTRKVRAAFDQANLSKIAVAAAANGTWCGDRFTPVQTEFHIELGDRPTPEDSGDTLAQAFDIFSAIPPDDMPGKLPPRIVVLTDWTVRYLAITTLPEARALRDAGLTGASLNDKVGFRLYP